MSIPGGPGAHVGDGVDGPVGVEGRHEGREIVQGDRERHAQVEGGVAVDADAPARRLQAPVGVHVHGDEAVLGEADALDAVLGPVDDDPLGRGRARLDLPGDDRQVLDRGGHAALGGPLVDREAGEVGQDAERGLVLAEQVVLAPFGIELLQRLPEPHLLHDHVGGRATGEVAELLDLDAVDPALDRQERHRQGLGDEPGIAPARPHRGVARGAGLDDAGPVLVAEADASGEQVAARGDDVGARPEERDHVVHQLVLGEAGPGLALAGGPGHVDDAVRPEGQDRGAIGRGQDAGRALAAQLAGIDAVLGVVVDADAHQVEARVADDLAQSSQSGVAGRPLHDGRHEAIVTGSESQPRTVEVGARTACSSSTSHSGKRLRTSSMAMRPSSRARLAPRQ